VDPNVPKPNVLDREFEECHPAPAHLGQRNREIRPGDRNHETREPGARPQIAERPGGRQAGHRPERIQEVAIAEPRKIPGGDQPKVGGAGSKELLVAIKRVQSIVTKFDAKSRNGRWPSLMFHVKHRCTTARINDAE
jgi:hypothetical protein